MSELILNTFSPMLNYTSLNYINIISEFNELNGELNGELNYFKQNKNKNKNLGGVVVNQKLNLNNVQNRNFDLLNKTYPLYKKKDNLINIKHKLARSFSFDIIL